MKQEHRYASILDEPVDNILALLSLVEGDKGNPVLRESLYDDWKTVRESQGSSKD